MRLVDEQRPLLGFVPRVQFTGAVEGIAPAVADQLLPVLREALTNVARHAGADQARISIEVDREVVVRVADNGVGVPDDVIEGNGLPNLGDRAASLGGGCTVGRADGGGTLVEWRVPAER